MLIAELVDVVRCTRTRLNNGSPIVPMLKLNFALRNKRCLNVQQQQSWYLMVSRMMDHSSKQEKASRVSSNCDVMETAFRKPVIVMQLLLGAQFRTVSRTMRSSYVSHKSQNVRNFKKQHTLEHHHRSQLWCERNVQEPLYERYSDASCNNADRTAL